MQGAQKDANMTMANGLGMYAVQKLYFVLFCNICVAFKLRTDTPKLTDVASRLEGTSPRRAQARSSTVAASLDEVTAVGEVLVAAGVARRVAGPVLTLGIVGTSGPKHQTQYHA